MKAFNLIMLLLLIASSLITLVSWIFFDYKDLHNVILTFGVAFFACDAYLTSLALDMKDKT